MAPISNLQDVKTWLGTLKVGDLAGISSGMFSAPLVEQALKLLPDSDPIVLKVTAIDVDGATISGTAAIVGEVGTAAVFAFTQPATDLLLTLSFTLPSTVEWTLIPSLGVTFGSLAATLTPFPDLKVVGVEFDAAISTTTVPPLNLPISLVVPTFDGDWTLSSTDVPVGALTADALNALAGGVDVLGMLPAELADLSKLKLATFQVAFNVAKGTCTLLRLSMEYDGDWSFFDGKFLVQSINFDVEVFNPFTAKMSYDGKLYAQMQIPPLPPFDVGGQFPDAAVFAQLAPDAVLKLSDVFLFFGLTVPSGMPDVEVSTLGFTLHPSDGAFTFNLAITKPVPIWQQVALDSFLFNIGAQKDGTGKLAVSGGLYAGFTVASTTLSITAAYSQAGGLDLIGEATNIPLGEIIADIGTKFGIPATDIPEPIRNSLKIDSLRVELNTGQTTFDFTCVGRAMVSGTEVDFFPTIHVNYGAATASATFSGVLILKVPQPDKTTKDLAFTVIFSESKADTWLEAKFSVTGGVIEFGDIAAVFGATLPPIPSDLDLALKEVAFRYDFSSGALTFGVQSANYGKAVFVAQKISDTPQYFFLLNANQTFSLSNLPLVGEQLAKLEDISLTKLGVIISTLDKVDGTTADAINKQITEALGTDYPLIPKAGFNGKILLAGELDFGKDTLPLSVALGGSSTAKALPATAGAGVSLARVGEVLTASSSDGITWFNVQRSFGPVSINRIGVLYQSETQTLWFELDATLKFGPLTLSLVGLGIGSPLKSFSPKFGLQGLGVAYSAPPVEIAGALINLAPPGATYIEFAGAVTIGTGTFTVQAFGYYGNKLKFSSMFLFGDLIYPFGGPPAFFVTGVALGFGYNSNLNIPTINQIQVFPFIQVLGNSAFFGPNPTPMDVLEKMILPDPKTNLTWVEPQQNSLWFGAGIMFTSFELVNSVAMIFVEAGADLVIALLGVSRAQFPQAVPDLPNEPVYAYIELDLELRFAPTEGVFSLEAVLASSSFLLSKACVLTGGFAFYVWFGSNPHAGDFVVSLGGYHPGFTPPDYYPKVPRVGFHWSLDSTITIQGGTYFALTPAALMVGGALSATYQSGNLKAWFNAHADIIVRWKPFWFDAEIGITIGASYTMDLLFTSATFTLELGVDLELWGPPTGGRVSVHWYIISFSIPFGSGKESGQQITGWDDGVNPMLPNAGTEAAPTVLSLTPTAGLTPTGTGPQQQGPKSAAGDEPAEWIVRGSQFGFAIDSPIPATTIAVGEQAPIQGKTFDVYPLKWSNVSATQTITVASTAGPGDFSTAFDITVTVKDVSAALWGAPPQTSSGQPQVPDGTKLLVPAQNMGISALVKVPTLGPSAGSVDVAACLAYDNLSLQGAVNPLKAGTAPVGDMPVNSDKTVGIIASATVGIGAPDTKTARDSILVLLGTLGFAPSTKNDSMADFAAEANCLLAAQPLLVAPAQDA